MEKRIPYSVFQSVKRVAQACDPLITKRNGKLQKIQQLQQEYDELDDQVKNLEAGIKSMTGLRVEQMVKKVIEPTGEIDQKTGKPIKKTKYVTTDIVSYDQDKKQYVISLPDAETLRVPAESNYGSDFDIDKNPKEEKAIDPVDMEVFQ